MRAFAKINSIDRDIVVAPRATVGIVTCGKAHFDLLEVFRRLDIPLDALAAAGVRIHKIGLAYPVEPTRLDAFADGLDEILVVEEKAGLVEQQLRDLFYNRAVRPKVIGKRDASGQPLVSELGELRPSRLIEIVARWLADRFPQLDRRHLVRDFTIPELLSNEGDAVKRVPYFCAGCPHNTSTKVPEGSRAQAGIGCHFMASWMDRDTEGLIQMGGEGVDWVSHAMFTKVPHVFQNLGDGTYYHSGYLAIRQAIAARTNVTYKILFNDAVAMTGGQPVDGIISVDAIARQVEAEGATKVVVLSDDIAKYDAIHAKFPAGTEFHDRAELDAVQRRLREMPGVTILIYEQTCAAEKRRRRKKGELVDPARRLYINDRVCEGCGDCSVQSNCVAVLPLETELGRKREIDQSTCNKDYSCAKGFCPSFVGIVGGRLKKRPGALAGPAAARFAAVVDKLPLPAPHAWTGPYDLLVTGVGGTGVVTVGALIAMAAHLEGHSASVLDFMGFAQKGGSVLSFVRLARDKAALNQVRIDAQQADAVLACDVVVAASADALLTVRHGRTRVLANRHEIPVAESLSNPDADLRVDALLEKIEFAAGADRVETMDAQRLAQEFVGDTIVANIVAMGYAWQRGLVPVGLAAMQRAIELNGVAVDANKAAFSLGRLAAADPAAASELLHEPAAVSAEGETLDALIERSARFLVAYQNAAYADRYRRTVAAVRAREQEVVGAGAALPLTRAVAEQLRKLMAYKDEYEVGRLYTDGEFAKALADRFEGDDLRLEFYMAPPALVKPKAGGAKAPKKVRFGPWLMPVLKLLARAKGLRGTAFDPFGRTEERRLERRPDRRLRGARRRARRRVSAPTSTRWRWRSPTCRRRSAATATSSWRASRSRGRARASCSTASIPSAIRVRPAPPWRASSAAFRSRRPDVPVARRARSSGRGRQVLAELRDQRLARERLDDEVGGAGLHAAHQRLEARLAAQHDDGNRRQVGRRLDPLGEGDAVAAGQHHVHQHEVGADGVDAVERRRTVGLEHEVDRLRFEHGGDERVQRPRRPRRRGRPIAASRLRRRLPRCRSRLPSAPWRLPAGRSAPRGGRWSRAGPDRPVPGSAGRSRRRCRPC